MPELSLQNQGCFVFPVCLMDPLNVTVSISLQLIVKKNSRNTLGSFTSGISTAQHYKNKDLVLYT